MSQGNKNAGDSSEQLSTNILFHLSEAKSNKAAGTSSQLFVKVVEELVALQDRHDAERKEYKIKANEDEREHVEIMAELDEDIRQKEAKVYISRSKIPVNEKMVTLTED